VLDVHNLPPCSYMLEVSSPGPQRPIYRDEDFLRFQGRRIKVRTREKIEGKKSFSGVLLSYREEGGEKTLRLEAAEMVFTIPRSMVVSARLDEEIDF